MFVCLPVALSAILILLYTPQFLSDCSETSHTCWMWSPHCVKLFSKFGPPIENEKNRILNVQLIYMGYAACETCLLCANFALRAINMGMGTVCK